MSAIDWRGQYFGTRLTPCSFADWLTAIDNALARGQRRHLSCHHNLHSLYLRHRDPAVADFYTRCDDCYIDGQAVRLVHAGFGRQHTAASRFSLMDTFEALLAHAQARGWRLYYLGARPEVAEHAQRLIRERYPRLHMQIQHGYFHDDDAVIADINAHRPDLLLVGLGMPRQEAWLHAHLQALDVGCATQAGGTLDYFAGAQARPPQWLSRAGLAWLYRLVHDPRRLWRRYVLEPWLLLPVTLRHWRHWHRADHRE